MGDERQGKRATRRRRGRLGSEEGEEEEQQEGCKGQTSGAYELAQAACPEEVLVKGRGWLHAVPAVGGSLGVRGEGEGEGEGGKGRGDEGTFWFQSPFFALSHSTVWLRDPADPLCDIIHLPHSLLVFAQHAFLQHNAFCVSATSSPPNIPSSSSHNTHTLPLRP